MMIRKLQFLIIFFLMINISFADMEVGINLNGISDWTSQWPFVDIMKISRWWITHNADGTGGWDTGYDSLIPVDANYYPTQIPFDPDGNGAIPAQIVRTVWDNNWLPTGNYTLICEGTGRIRFWGAGSGTYNITNGGTFTVSIPNKGFLAMEIEQSQMGNHLRNIRLIMPGFAGTYQTNPYHPLFLQRITPFKIIRFMDWGATNDSNLENWADRAKVSDYTWTLKGVPYEIMIDLVNRLDKSPWICIPHRATDDYIRQLIILLKNNLTTNKKIYLEYSNETWNWQFSQANYCEQRGQALGLPSFYGYRWAYHCKRACDIWRIFKQEFGSTDKLVKILATQVGWGSGTPTDPYPIQFMLNTAMNNTLVNPDKERADAIAIAPYFAPINMANLPESITVDEILNLCQQDIINMTSSTGMVTGHKNVANQYGAKLICYEGGQHMVRSDSDILTDKFIQANRDIRIYNLYIDYLNRLNAVGVNEFCHFVDCGSWSKWGMWGAMEYQDQSIDTAHKYRALIDWINTHITQTPTATISVTFYIPSATRTATRTITPSMTFGVQSATWTATRTPTASATFNVPSATSTTTRTITPSWTQTMTVTRTQTPSVTSSFVATNTRTVTRTNTSVVTDTFTATATYTQTVTPTYTRTETPTWSISSTHSISPTITQTWTGTPPTSTNTPAITFTSSVTNTNTFTATQTATSTWTSTPTFTYTRTRTQTYTPTLSFTQTPTNSQQLINTLTPSVTLTITITPIQTSSGNWQMAIGNLVIFPNPYNLKYDLNISFNISQNCRIIKVKIWTAGLRLIKEIEYPQYNVGENILFIENRVFKNYANGIYLLTLEAINYENEKIISQPQVLVVIK